MGPGRNFPPEIHGKYRNEPRLFPERARDAQASQPTPESAGTSTGDTRSTAAEPAIRLSDFRARIRAYIMLAWLLPPTLSIFLQLYQEIYSPSDVALVLKRFSVAYIVIGTLAASLLLTRHAMRIAASVTDAAGPDKVDWRRVRERLKRLQWILFASFAAYCMMGSLIADIVLGNARGEPFTASEHILSLLATAPAVIVTAIPIFFRLFDLIGAFFAERGGAFIFVSIGAKVAALGLLTPMMISAALLVYYRDRTGFLSPEAVALCGVLMLAAVIGTHTAWASFRHSLAPFHAPLGDIFPGDVSGSELRHTSTRLVPNTLDEIGLLVCGSARLAERDRMLYAGLWQKEEQIRMITDSLPVLIAYVDSDERFRFVNGRYHEWWRVEPRDLIGKSISELFPPELYAKKSPRIAAALAGVETTDRTEFVYPDGKKRICEVRYVPHKSDDGAVLGYFALVLDVTERKEAEQAATKAQRRLLDAIECMPAGFALYDKDERLVVTNSRRREMTAWHGDSFTPGVKFEQFLRNTVASGAVKEVDSRNASAVDAYVAKRLEDFRSAADKPVELQRNDGTTVMSLFHKTSDGGTVGVMLDITEQKLAEQAARLADQRLRDAIESMPAGFRIFDANDRLVLWNSKYAEQTRWHGGHIEAGITYEEILKKTVAVRDWIDQTAEDEGYIRNRLAEFRDPGAPFEMSRSDGRHFLHLYRKTADGGTVAVMHEITDQKQAEQQAERERQRLMDSINSLPVGFRLYDQDERLVYSNDHKTDQFAWRSDFLNPGATYEEILRQSVANGLHVHDMESDEAYIEYRLREFRHSDGKPIERRRSDGRTGLMFFRKTSDGETACIVIDITEQKKAEEQALENHRRLHDATESLPAGFCLFDADDRLVLFNSVQKDTTVWHGDLLKPGVTYEEILRNSIEKGMYLHEFPSDEDYFGHQLKQFRNAQPVPFELHYATGRHALKFTRKTSSGGTVTIQMDVTERVEAEKRAKEASQRLFDAIESLPVGFCLFNKDEQLVIYNTRQRDATPWHDKALRFGVTFEELVQDSLAARCYRDLDYDDPSAVDAFAAKRLEHFRRAQGIPVELNRSDGTSTLNVFHKTTDGGTVSVMLDITERKRAEQALKASEGRLNAILDLAPEAIITADENHRIQMFNAGAERLFGYKTSETGGRNLQILFADQERSEFDDGETVAEPVPPAWQMAGRREMIALHRSGREFPVEISVAETLIDGALLHTVLLQDISERKRWEDDLRHAMQLADAANRAKSEFLSHMSHELRTPLNGILGYAEFIKDKWLGDDALDKYVEYAGFITDSGQHLLQLINDILDLSKVESGQYQAVFEKIDIAELFKESELIVAADAEKAGIVIDFNIQPGSSPWIADRRALKQILINLLSNGIKFSDAGSRIDVRSSRDETGHYRLAVADTGIGMTEAEAKRALEPFIQVSQPYVTQQKGTGLGLALVVRLAELHHGTVQITSQPQQGTTVQVSFPPLPHDAGAAEPSAQLSA